MKRLMVMTVLMGLAGGVMAQEGHAPTTSPAGQTQPVLPEHANWAGSMVIMIVGMFVAAAVIGVVVRLNMPEQPPEPQPHDDHGHGHDDHGHGGGHGHDDHSKGHGH